MSTFASASLSLPRPLIDEDPSLFYKIYVGLERDAQQKITHIDVIDGWLRGNECLVMKFRQNLDNNISYFELEVVPSDKVNTFLRIPVEQPLLNTVLVRVFKKGQCLGYQWIDLEGNLLHWPKRDTSKKEPVQARS